MLHTYRYLNEWNVLSNSLILVWPLEKFSFEIFRYVTFLIDNNFPPLNLSGLLLVDNRSLHLLCILFYKHAEMQEDDKR